MTYQDILERFKSICPIKDLKESRPNKEDSVTAWSENGQIFKITYVSDDEFIVNRSSSEEWFDEVFKKEEQEGKR